MDRPTLSLLDALPISALPAEAGPTWILTLGRSKVGSEERVDSVQGEARMADARPKKLDRPVDVRRDHVLGNPSAAMTLVEYGSRSEEHTSELQSLMSISYAVFCMKKNSTHKCTQSYD